jgi:hypothetical protein
MTTEPATRGRHWRPLVPASFFGRQHVWEAWMCLQASRGNRWDEMAEASREKSQGLTFPGGAVTRMGQHGGM